MAARDDTTETARRAEFDRFLREFESKINTIVDSVNARRGSGETNDVTKSATQQIEISQNAQTELTERIRQFSRQASQTSSIMGTLRESFGRLNSTTLNAAASIATTFIRDTQRIKENELRTERNDSRLSEIQAKKLLAAQTVGETKTKTNILLQEITGKKLKDLTSDEITSALSQLNITLNEQEQTVKELNDEAAKVLEDGEQLRRETKSIQFQRISNALSRLSDAFVDMEKAIRQTQQQFGVAAGAAARLNFDDFVATIKSNVGALTSLGGQAAVSSQERAVARSSFQSEFGGVISTEAAEGIARQAKEMGVTTQQLAAARRVFMTQTGGDLGRATAAQDRLIATFEKRGLTSKDAMDTIAKNSELFARNGTRFADSFARAAADAKKIGVDLGRVDQVGDNIIGNFEGFLEKQAELGAMGFNLDGNRLAQVAESGDTGELQRELRSQLAATGKDLNNLKRSQQLALSGAFGIPMAELQRMAGGEDGSGEKMEDLQKEGNGLLERMVNLLSPLGGLLNAIGTGISVVMAGLLTAIQINTAITAGRSVVGGMLTGRGRVSRTARRVVRAVRRSRAGSLLGRGAAAPFRPTSRAAARLGTGGVLAAAVGGISGFMTARKEGRSVSSSAGRGAVQGGFAAGGAVLGTALAGPLGTIIGGFLGNSIGKAVNKYLPELGEGLGIAFKEVVKFFEPVKKAFIGIGTAFKPLMEAFGKLFSMFDGPGREAGSAATYIGAAIGILLKGALLPLNLVLQGLAMTIKLTVQGFTLLVNIVTAVLSLLTFDTEKIKNAWGDLGSSILDIAKTLGSAVVSALVTSVSVISSSLAEKLVGLVRKIPFVGKFLTGDDVVSKAGYGERTLTTPESSIALNNNDNVVAYAPQSIPTPASAVQMLSYGALATTTGTTTTTSAAPPSMTATVDTIQTLSSGQSTRPTGTPTTTTRTPQPVSQFDTSRLEAKLDGVINAIGSMRVEMDGKEVGKILVNVTETASQLATFRNQSRATL